MGERYFLSKRKRERENTKDSLYKFEEKRDYVATRRKVRFFGVDKERERERHVFYRDDKLICLRREGEICFHQQGEGFSF